MELLQVKQVSYPNLLRKVADKEYTRIQNRDVVIESHSYMDECFMDQTINDALNFMFGAEQLSVFPPGAEQCGHNS
jgi:hypothetical protein